jgi:hypothetical protein
MIFETDAGADRRVSNKTVIMTCLAIGAFFFFLNDVIGLINGGGIFSATSAIKAAHAHVLSLDVDRASLRTLFLVFCAFSTTMICKWLRLDIDKRWTQLIFMLCIVGGGFILDAVYGPWMIENYLIRSGYSRCAEQDHSVGSGKGRVWLDNYVLDHTVCASRS